MQEHIKVGREYPEIDLNTSYSFGLDDQEFVVAFETDDPGSFLDLVQRLRTTESSEYTQARHADVHLRVDVGRAGAERARRRGAAGLDLRRDRARTRIRAPAWDQGFIFALRCRCRVHDPASCRALPAGDAQRLRRARVRRAPEAAGHARRHQVRPSEGHAGRQGRGQPPATSPRTCPYVPGVAPRVRPPLLARRSASADRPTTTSSTRRRRRPRASSTTTTAAPRASRTSPRR